MARDAETRIRKALASEDFAKARRFWDEYLEELRLTILRGEATPGDLAKAAALLEAARASAMTFRAHAAARLGQAQAAMTYGRRL